MEKRDESRLPKWAQTELRVLRMRVTEREAEIVRLTGTTETEHPEVFYKDYTGSVIKQYGLPSGSRVMFDLLLNGSIEAAIDHSDPKSAKRKLTIRTLRGPLVIQPAASNSIYVSEGEY